MRRVVVLVLALGAAAVMGATQAAGASFEVASARSDVSLTADESAALEDSIARDGDCQPQWASDLFCQPGLNGHVYAAVSWDDGTGEALYIGGEFTIAECATVANIARWDGSAWSALDSGLNGRVWTLTVFDDGGGPALYAGGQFTTAGGQEVNRVARWDGSSWSSLGAGVGGASLPEVRVLTVFDDGMGPALYVGGQFTTADGQGANCIARWNGTTWSPLGTGLYGQARALSVFDDGSGSALYVGGSFITAGGQLVHRIARWDGSSWSAVGSGMNNSVFALTMFDDGSGPALYAGGFFTAAGGVSTGSVARWNGSEWAPLGVGVSNAVEALTVFDDGSGPALFAGGHFSRVARWDGKIWSSLEPVLNDSVHALAVFDDGSGPALFAGGQFWVAGGQTALHIARWNGSVWLSLGSGVTSAVKALTFFDDGSGPALVAGGDFTAAGGQEANRVARWDGSRWSPLGSGMNNGVLALAVFDDGSGPALYAGGLFTKAGGQTVNFIARWDGWTWSPLGTGLNGAVYDLVVFDDGGGAGPALYVGGHFTTAGGQTANRVARWDGGTWSPLGTGIDGSSLPTVDAFEVLDDGSGTALYAGGGFSIAGGQPASNVARWDGAAWSPLGMGLNGRVADLAVFDNGGSGGPTLYAGGSFTTADGLPANRVACWDGSAWSALGAGVNSWVSALAVFDDGGGDRLALYAGGGFSTAGGQAAGRIARWDGSTWSPVGIGMDSPVYTLAVSNIGGSMGPALYAGGSFIKAGGNDSAHLAKWQGCASGATCPTDLNTDGLLNFFDIAFFVNLYQVQDPVADWNSDGLINFIDLASYLNAFNAGCP